MTTTTTCSRLPTESGFVFFEETNPQETSESTLCTICYEMVEAQATALQHRAGHAQHKFHPECIQDWLNTQITTYTDFPHCPTCRETIANPTVIHPAYLSKLVQELNDLPPASRKKSLIIARLEKALAKQKTLLAEGSPTPQSLVLCVALSQALFALRPRLFLTHQ